MLRRAVALFASTASLTWSLTAAALGDVTIYDNAQSIPIGGRAAGMGGAYTALACDEGALHYNPASLSCASASHLELTANAYVLQGFRATGALGPGGNISATTYHSVPSIVGARVVAPVARAAASAPVPLAASQAEGIVVFKVKAQSWIQVTDGKGNVALRKLLAAGESASATGALPLTVTVGSVSATRVEVRGQPFDLAALARDNVARFEVK